MNSHEIEGRLAALELVAAIALHRFGIDHDASRYPLLFPKLLERVKEAIDNGTFPAPAEPQSKEAMKNTLHNLFERGLYPFPPPQWVREIEEELSLGRSPDSSSGENG